MGSSQVTPPRYFLRPGMRALQAGVKHALYAENLVDIFYPNKKQKTMPAIPSQKYGRSTSRTKKYKKTSKGSKSAIKKTILSMATTYNAQKNDNVLAQNMTMNNIYSTTISRIGAGTADDQRIGDEVYLLGLKVKGNFITPTASNAYQYRIIVGWSGEEYNLTNFGSSGAATGLTSTELFMPQSGAVYATTHIINNKAFNVLYDQTIDLNSQLTGTSDIYGVDFYLPLNKKFPYQAAGSFFGKFKNLYLVVVSTVGTGGTPLTTASGNCNLNTCLLFKNL